MSERPEPQTCSTRIACSLTPEALRAGRAGLLPGLRERALQATPTDSGYRLTFATTSETLRAIVDTIDAERQCCPWLTFYLAVGAGGSPTHLTLGGPAGARDFLAALFDQ